jgi:hypothetical protein
MKTNRFLFAAICLAIASTMFFACSGDLPDPNSGGQEQQEERVFCKLNAGNCSEMTLSTCLELVNAGSAQIVSSCDASPPQPSSSSTPYVPPPPSSSSTPYVPPPPSSSSTPYVPPTPSSSSALPPNAVEITLTEYRELASLDPIGYGDPRVSFRVRAYQQRTLLNDNTTKLLLDREDVNLWTGTATDIVTISVSADSVIVNPIVKEADALSDDDYSPSGVYVVRFTNGSTFNNNEAKNDKVSVKYNLKFIRR